MNRIKNVTSQTGFILSHSSPTRHLLYFGLIVTLNGNTEPTLGLSEREKQLDTVTFTVCINELQTVMKI